MCYVTKSPLFQHSLPKSIGSSPSTCKRSPDTNDAITNQFSTIDAVAAADWAAKASDIKTDHRFSQGGFARGLKPFSEFHDGYA
jgi:hypothetical protein